MSILSCNQEPWSGTETVSLKIRVHLWYGTNLVPRVERGPWERGWYGTLFLFLEQIAPSWRHISARIHADVGGSRVDVVTLPYRNGENFLQRWQGIRQGIRSMDLTCSCIPWTNGKGEFCRSRKQFRAVNLCEWIWSARTVTLNA